MPSLQTFHDSVKRGDLDAIRTALSEQPALLNQKNEAGQSAFVLASYYGQAQTASYLLSLNPELDIFSECIAGMEQRALADVDRDPALLASHNSDGWTPLHLAAFFGRVNLAAVLLERGADVNAVSTNQMQNAPLHAAVAGRKTEVVKLLVSQGANLNGRQTGGWTPLHGAAQNGDLEIVETLLVNGAHAHARADNNQSPLDLAMLRGHAEVVALLQLADEGSQPQ